MSSALDSNGAAADEILNRAETHSFATFAAKAFNRRGRGEIAEPAKKIIAAARIGMDAFEQTHSVMIRSAHSTSDTKIAGVPNFAPHWFKSASVTPRAREQAPQEKIGMCLATTLSRVSLKGGHPNGMIAFTVALRMV